MYLRRSEVRRGDKTHTYWRLVRSVRRGGKVRQETVAMLGELDAKGRAKATALAERFRGKGEEQGSLFDQDPPAEAISVHVDRHRVERSRSFGDVYLAWTLWKALKLDEFAGRVIPHGREHVPWYDVAAILVLARFCEPSSELHIAEDWYRKTALCDLLGVPVEAVYEERLYRGLDRLLEHKCALQVHLKDRLGTLFDLKYDLMLYDVTSTYFEGKALQNPKARRGYSRDHRPDCKQVCIALVVTREGYPVGFEIFPGNTIDVTTVETIVGTMEERYGKSDRIWVMDRGMTSEANLKWMKKGNRSYIVGAPKATLRKVERKLLEKSGWSHVRDGLSVKLCESPDGGGETFILCRSAERKEKEQAMRDNAAERIRADLKSIANRLKTSKAAETESAIGLQIGRLLQRNQRGAAAFEIDILKDASRKSGLKLKWRENLEKAEHSRLTDGAYWLRTNITDWKPEELWATYVQLSQAEAVFRIQKSELRIRPVWHQREDRVDAHIFVCFIAYAMWKTLEGWIVQAGVGKSIPTIIEDLKRLVAVDVVLPLENGREMKLTCIAQPDKDTAVILDRLGLRPPTRLRSPRGVAVKM